MDEGKIGTDLKTIVVWLPMVPGDNARSARSAVKIFDGHPVAQYYDPYRRTGRMWMEGPFEACIDDALSALRPDHPMRPVLEEWTTRQRSERVLWDVAMLYRPGIRWDRKAPAPYRWSKQVAFFPSETDDSGDSGNFWRNSCREEPTNSDWYDELSDLLDARSLQFN